MKNVAVVMGGYSAEKVISMKSGEIALKYLKKKNYKPYKIIIEKNNWQVIYKKNIFLIDQSDFSVIINGRKIIFEVVFIAIHGAPGENGELQCYLDQLQIPYTNSGSKATALSFDKAACNNFLRKNGILCAHSYLLNKEDKILENEIIKKVGLPCFVKPNKHGSSFGVSKVNEKKDLKKALKNAFLYDKEVLIESFIDGTEVTCGAINFNNTLMTLPSTEIISQNDFFDFNAKYNGESIEITPARISQDLSKIISKITKKVYTLIKLDGIARIDFIIQNNKPYLIEVNTVPGLSEESIIPKQAACAGISLDKLFDDAVKHALRKK